MTLITPEERVSRTAELLQSLEGSVQRVRQQAEDLITQMAEGAEPDFVNGNRQVSAIEALVKTCQRVEASLVEQIHKQAGIAQGGYALDLEQARSEIGCRLARLRACCGAGDISE